MERKLDKPEKKAPAKLTLLDIAKKAGVSRSLASLAIRGEPGVTADKRARILKIAEELNYTPDPAARNLASNATRTIGILVSDILNPFSASLAKSIDAAAREKGFDVLLSIEGHPDTDAQKAINSLLARRVAGLILIGTPESPELIERVGRRIPVVYVGRHLSNERIDSVSNDDFLGASMLVRHLVEQGHRDIVHVDGGESAGSQRRREAYQVAMLEHGLTPRVVKGQHTLDGGSTATDAVLSLEARPTAIFASNDLAAVGVLNRLLQAGIGVPTEIAVAGYDDMPFAGTETMSLTTIRQPIDRMASQSMDVLLARMQNPKEPAMHVLIVPSLVVRASTQQRK
ncbi:LacI family DNA-binding transcriptional regulator [Paraburkholderia bannensis]|uniref:LacI family DNA-binding transcriptional regulator n=1 Tax=Paraburkholderia bannensis TaxID=765414 RepID=UPI002AC31CF0|nr:LacI family DNA-binding transcriptional regulator [Paraburkholderia bannensis]